MSCVWLVHNWNVDLAIHVSKSKGSFAKMFGYEWLLYKLGNSKRRYFAVKLFSALAWCISVDLVYQRLPGVCHKLLAHGLGPN